MNDRADELVSGLVENIYVKVKKQSNYRESTYDIYSYN